MSTEQNTKMEPKFKVQNPWTYDYEEHIGEVNNQPSMTIPDQTMSLREILTRYASGLPIDNIKTPIYEGEDWTPDPSKMDLADREQLAKSYKNEVEQIKEKFGSNKQIDQITESSPEAV